MSGERDNMKEKKGNGEKAPQMPEMKQASELDIRKWELASCRMEVLMVEQENVKLKRENSALRKTIAELKCQLDGYQFDTMQGAINEKIATVNPQYNAITKKIADDCGIKDPKRMSIDTESFVVRDLGT